MHYKIFMIVIRFFLHFPTIVVLEWCILYFSGNAFGIILVWVKGINDQQNEALADLTDPESLTFKLPSGEGYLSPYMFSCIKVKQLNIFSRTCCQF